MVTSAEKPCYISVQGGWLGDVDVAAPLISPTPQHPPQPGRGVRRTPIHLVTLYTDRREVCRVKSAPGEGRPQDAD